MSNSSANRLTTDMKNKSHGHVGTTQSVVDQSHHVSCFSPDSSGGLLELLPTWLVFPMLGKEENSAPAPTEMSEKNPSTQI